jgi:hypothetical protein
MNPHCAVWTGLALGLGTRPTSIKASGASAASQGVHDMSLPPSTVWAGNISQSK